MPVSTLHPHYTTLHKSPPKGVMGCSVGKVSRLTLHRHTLLIISSLHRNGVVCSRNCKSVRYDKELSGTRHRHHQPYETGSIDYPSTDSSLTSVIFTPKYTAVPPTTTTNWFKLVQKMKFLAKSFSNSIFIIIFVPIKAKLLIKDIPRINITIYDKQL